MYAVIEHGGKQYKVQQGDCIDIELTEVDSAAKTIELDKVLFVGEQDKEPVIGVPYIEGAKVIAKFAGTADEAVVKGPKVYPAYRRRRKNSRTRTGHRQKYLQVTVEEIKKPS